MTSQHQSIDDLNFQLITFSIMGSALPVFKFHDDDFFFCLRDWAFADFCDGASGDCHAGNTAVVL